MRKPRIAILINTMTGGGSERTVSHLLHGMRDEFEIHLLLFSKVIEYELPEGQIIEYLDDETGRSDVLNLLRIPILANRLTAYCEAHEIELVLSFLPRPNFVACLAKRRGMTAKLAISERVYTPMYYRSDELRGRIGLWLTRRLYPYADMILPNSHGTLTALRDDLDIPGKYHLFRNVVDVSGVRRMSEENITDDTFDGFTFICAAAFRVQKNHRVLLDAFELMASQRARLLLVGKGPELERVRNYASTLHSRDRIIFIGHKLNPYPYMRRSDALVLASNFEGFPNVILEAFACGLPVIATDCPTGPRELLGSTFRQMDLDGGNVQVGGPGVLVPSNDAPALAAAMGLMMNDPDLRARLSLETVGKAFEFEKDVVIGELRALLHSLLQGH